MKAASRGRGAGVASEGHDARCEGQLGMTATLSQMPLHMRRNGFGPVDELGQIRDEEGVCPVEAVFGRSAYLVSRYADVREVLPTPTASVTPS